tara:strand:- start:10248 stop:12371 length:2124 start_codon:yes stop_codon:yes gene_type:complete
MDALRRKLATLGAINEGLRDENEELRGKATSMGGGGGDTASSGRNAETLKGLQTCLDDSKQVIASLTRQRDELEEQVLETSTDGSDVKKKLEASQDRLRTRERELEAQKREVGACNGERRKLELRVTDALRERDGVMTKLKKMETQSRFAAEDHEKEKREATLIITDLRRRATLTEQNAANERTSLRQHLEAATNAAEAAFGEEAKHALGAFEKRTTAAEAEAARCRRLADEANSALRAASDAFEADLAVAEVRARKGEGLGRSVDAAVAEALGETAFLVSSANKRASRLQTELKELTTDTDSRVRALADQVEGLGGKLAQRTARVDALTRELATSAERFSRVTLDHRGVVDALRARVKATESESARANAAAAAAAAESNERDELFSANEKRLVEAEETLRSLVLQNTETSVSHARFAGDLAEARETINRLEGLVTENEKNDAEKVRRSPKVTTDTEDKGKVPRSRERKNDKPAETGVGSGFDVNALVAARRGAFVFKDEIDEASLTRREKRLLAKERVAQTDLVRTALNEAELKFQDTLHKARLETADVTARLGLAQGTLVEIAAGALVGEEDSEQTNSESFEAQSSASGSLEKERPFTKEKARLALARLRCDANESRAKHSALMRDHETLLEVLGEKTEAVDVLERKVSVFIAEKETREAMDAHRTVLRNASRSALHELYVSTQTHELYVSGRGVDRGMDLLVDE